MPSIGLMQLGEARGNWVKCLKLSVFSAAFWCIKLALLQWCNKDVRFLHYICTAQVILLTNVLIVGYCEAHIICSLLCQHWRTVLILFIFMHFPSPVLYYKCNHWLHIFADIRTLQAFSLQLLAQHTKTSCIMRFFFTCPLPCKNCIAGEKRRSITLCNLERNTDAVIVMEMVSCFQGDCAHIPQLLLRALCTFCTGCRRHSNSSVCPGG